jgi:HSP20 family protein
LKKDVAMAVLTKSNGNAPVATRMRAQSVPTPYDFFPDVLGLSRVLDSMLSSVPAEAAVPVFLPAIDISEQDGNYIIEAAVPGFAKDDISIEVSSNQVTISGRHEEREEEGRKRRYSEIRRAAFTRTLVLPREVDPDSAKATFENGVLKITLKPTTPIGAKKVQIEAQSASSSQSSSSSSSPSQPSSSSQSPSQSQSPSSSQS